jgi:hypothetical protein
VRSEAVGCAGKSGVQLANMDFEAHTKLDDVKRSNQHFNELTVEESTPPTITEDSSDFSSHDEMVFR